MCHLTKTTYEFCGHTDERGTICLEQGNVACTQTSSKTKVSRYCPRCWNTSEALAALGWTVGIPDPEQKYPSKQADHHRFKLTDKNFDSHGS
jgi:hypothetical protein